MCRILALASAAFLLSLPTARLHAEPTVTAIPVIEGSALDAAEETSSVGCIVGISTPMAVAAVNYVPLEWEEMRLIADPTATCSSCGSGFRVTKVHLVVDAPESCTVQLKGNMGSVRYPSPSCPRPNTLSCSSGPVTVTLPSEGRYDIAIPMSTCPCADTNAKHTVGVQFIAMSSPVVFVTDGTPRTCTNWDNIGWGWVDLATNDPSWPGDLILYADAACCDVTGVDELAGTLERELSVAPNPFGGVANVSFALRDRAHVRLMVHDVAGRNVATLLDDDLERGPFESSWDGTDDRGSRVPAGIYFLRLELAGESITRKVVFVR